MAWEVLFAPEFEAWLDEQAEEVADGIARVLRYLATDGPQLGRPHVDSVKGSRVGNLEELRIRVGRAPYRVLFAFDPIRRAILLLGGDKSGEKRWYQINIPIAEERFDLHLARLEEEEGRPG